MPRAVWLFFGLEAGLAVVSAVCTVVFHPAMVIPAMFGASAATWIWCQGE